MQNALTITGIVANVVTIGAVGFLVWQIIIAVEQTRLAREAMREERERQEAERAQHRDALLMALGLEVHAIRESIDLDERLFQPTTGLQDDRAKSRHIAVSTEGESGYRRGYAWTPLPFGTVEQAIRDGNLLAATFSQVTDLLSLRQGVLRANAAIGMKASAVSAFLAGETAGQGISMSYRRLADARMDNLNGQIEEEFRSIRNLSQQILHWVDEKQRQRA